MKILVFGHSNSDGSMLPDANDGWPWVLRGLLAEAGVQCEVTHKKLFAGPNAAAMLQRTVEKEQPDVVILATSTFGVVVRLMSNRIRERWGERAGRLAQRMEQHNWRQRRRRNVIVARAYRPLRRTLRRIIGVSATHSVDKLATWYEDCFRTLAQFEDVQGIIITGVGYGPAVDRLNPGWQGPQDQVYARLKPAALSHRFAWVPHEELLGGPEAKLKYFQDDGVHTDAESHQVAAAALAPVILSYSR
jgi:lysophospholipase L1-like esterase